MRTVKVGFLCCFFAIVLTLSCVSKKTPPAVVSKPQPTATAAPKVVATPSYPEEGFSKVSWDKLNGDFDDSELLHLTDGVEESLKWLRNQKPERELSFGKQKIAVSRILETLLAVQSKLAEKPTAKDFQTYLSSDFELWQAVPAGGKELMATGYYIPKIQGSRFATDEFKVPVYGLPSDLITVSLEDFDESLAGKKFRGRIKGNAFVPYFNREQIRDKKNLVGRAQVLTWVRSEWDAFLIEVQGSGILQESGNEYLLSYADQNGRSYKAVGKLLLQEGKIPKAKMSMQAIGKYIESNPDDMRRVLDYNPSFVFFEKATGNAKGSLGVPLTGGRSVAIDNSKFPQAALAFIQLQQPSLDEKGNVGKSEQILKRYVLNQDTGGAIRGQGRLDFFWGAGPEAFEKAGAMQHSGNYYLVLKKR